jgi:hypothetical protein
MYIRYGLEDARTWGGVCLVETLGAISCFTNIPFDSRDICELAIIAVPFSDWRGVVAIIILLGREVVASHGFTMIGQVFSLSFMEARPTALPLKRISVTLT